ncbi:MAG TPA: hypothetical protein VI172_04050 [Candidatus Dormibacteraeota bacterium]
MNDLDALEHKLKHEPGWASVSETLSLPALIAELRSARNVVEAARPFVDVSPLPVSRLFDLSAALAEFDSKAA